MGSGFWFEAGALVPSLGVGLLFAFTLRAILRADRREREADRAAENEMRERESGTAGPAASAAEEEIPEVADGSRADAAARADEGSSHLQ